MPSKRVVITGVGVITSIGTGVSEFAESLRNGRSGASPITAFDTKGFPSRIACPVRDFDPKRWLRKLKPSRIGRSSQFCVAASTLALADARLDPSWLRGQRCGVIVGTTDGESVPLERLTAQWVTDGFSGLGSDLIRQVPADSLAVSVAREFGLEGEAVTVSTACAAGNYAIGAAYDMVSFGDAEFVLCGGADSLCRKTFAGFLRLGTIAPEMCQPFDIDRKGILTGEGAGMLLLESYESALSRNATMYAEVLGYALNCDATHMVAPDKESIAACMRLSHSRACISAHDVDYICAHGTGTRSNDLTEASAIRDVFDNPPPTSSIKSMLGHTMGAASALGAIACCVALKEGFLPPTINCPHPDPACGLDFVTTGARPSKLRIVQNNAFAFGGNNAILILGKPCREGS